MLGDASGAFYSPGINAYDSTATNTGVENGTAGDRIEEALFLNFKRLFARDEIRKETFAMRLYQTGALSRGMRTAEPLECGQNLAITSISGSAIYADVGSSNTQLKYLWWRCWSRKEYF